MTEKKKHESMTDNGNFCESIYQKKSFQVYRIDLKANWNKQLKQIKLNSIGLNCIEIKSNWRSLERPFWIVLRLFWTRMSLNQKWKTLQLQHNYFWIVDLWLFLSLDIWTSVRWAIKLGWVIVYCHPWSRVWPIFFSFRVVGKYHVTLSRNRHTLFIKTFINFTRVPESW